jgi:uncharacterized protein (TIGR04141 family)
MTDDIPLRSLTIYLSKENRRPNSLSKNRDGLTEKKVPVGGRVVGELLFGPLKAKLHVGLTFSRSMFPDEFGEVSSCSAVLLVPVYKRWAAVTFGQGRHFISSDAFEDRFGYVKPSVLSRHSLSRVLSGRPGISKTRSEQTASGIPYV